jgi:endoglucanase
MQRAGERPEVRVNQLGFLPAGPKRAVWASDAREPAAFRVRDRDGRTVAAGRTRPWPVRPEPTSGLAVQIAEFSDLRTVGAGFTVEVGGRARSHPFAIADDLYRGLVRDGLAFFYLQRSGIAIDAARAPGYGRPAGHPDDVSVAAWTGRDAERLYPGWSCPGRFDVSGGWYDAGDHGKYVTSGATPVWQLLAAVELLSRRGARTGWWAETEALLLEECRWQLDWLLRMQVPAGRPHAGLAFHRVHGSEWAPLPCWPHQDPTTRVLHRPSTAAALHLAAVAAHGARVFSEDVPYARRLLGAAVTAHRAARTEPWLLAPDDEGAFGGGPYADDELADEFAWAAAELWLATGDPAYREEARRALPEDALPLDGFDWNRMAAGAVLDLALHGDDNAAARVLAAADRLTELQAQQPWGQPYAPADGWEWGSNGRLLNNLVVLAVACELDGRDAHHAATARGMDYLLGQRAGPELRHGLRPRLLPPPAFAPLRARPRPGVPASAARCAGRWTDLQAPPGLADGPAPGRPAAAAVLSRRADVGDDERRLHPLERPAGVDERLPHAVTPASNGPPVAIGSGPRVGDDGLVDSSRIPARPATVRSMAAARAGGGSRRVPSRGPRTPSSSTSVRSGCASGHRTPSGTNGRGTPSDVATSPRASPPRWPRARCRALRRACRRPGR